MRRGAASVLAAALLFAAAARSSAAGGRVQGWVFRGERSTARSGLWRSVVQLWSSDGDCSATLIAPNVALTAAHCILEEGKLELPDSVRFYGPGGRVAATRRVVNARYSASYTGDSSMDRTDMALVLFEGRAPAGYELAGLLPDESVLTGAQVLVAGYGITDSRDRETGLHDATLDVDGVEGRYLTLRRRDQAGICDGDSGGPAFFAAASGRRLLAGVASASDQQTCRETQQSFFASVPQARAWIEANLAAFASGEHGLHAKPSPDTVDVVAQLARRLPRHVRPFSFPFAVPRF